MSVDADYIAQRLQALDPSTDVTDGSPAHAHVISPLLAKYGTDPLSTPIRDFLLARLKEEHPDLTIGTDADQIVDILVNPLVSVLEPFKRELTAIRQSQSTADPDLLSDAEADALLANLFFSRPAGTRAQFTVRIYYSVPTSVEVTQLTRFSTSSGLSFFPPTTQSITQEGMTLNQDGSLYYFDATVEAEKVGKDYNVAAGAIIQAEGLPTVAKVTNLTAADVKGTDLETNQEFVSRAEVALSERTLNTERGLAARIMDLLPAITKLQAIGYRDKEMERDIVKGDLSLVAGDLGLGPIVNMAPNGTALVGSHDFGGGEVVGDTTYHRRLVGVRVLKADLKKDPVVGNTVSIHHATRLTDDKSDQTADLDHVSDHIIKSVVETAGDATKWDVTFDDYLFIDQFGTAGATVALGDNSTGAVLSFSNEIEDVNVDLTKPGDPVSPGDLLLVEYDGGNDEAAFEVGTVLTTTRVRLSEGLAIIAQGVGDNQAAGTGISVKAAHGANKIGVPDAKVGTLTWLNRHIVIRKDNDDLILGAGGEEYFKVTAIGAAGSWPDGNDRTEVTLSANLAGAPDNDDYKWSLVAKDSTNSAAANLDTAAGGVDAPLPKYPSANIKWAVRRDKSGAKLAGFVDANAVNDLLYSERAPLDVATVNAGTKLTLSDIPGGITFPSTTEGELVIEDDKIHIGGMTDAYMRASDNVDAAPVTLDLEDDETLAQGVNGTIAAGGNSTFTSVTVNAGLANEMLAVDFGAKGVKPGDVLVLKDTNVGAYRITTVAGSVLTVINHADPGNDAFPNSGNNIRFEVVRTITVDLVAPKDTKIPNPNVNGGSVTKNPKDLITFASSNKVESRNSDNKSYVDFAQQGVEVGDTLEIHSGRDKGAYSITAIGGPFPNDELTIDATLIGGETGLEYSIYKPAAKGGVKLPLLRVSAIDRLDSGGQPVGIKIPYADPVDIRSSDFGNRGTGIKVPNTTMPGNDLSVTGTTVTANGDTDFLKSKIAPGDVLAWSTGDNAGTFQVVKSVTDKDTLILETAIPVDIPVGSGPPDLPTFTLGAPSIGSARCYFLDPTTFSVDGSATFKTASGLSYVPDPDNHAVIHDPAIYAGDGQVNNNSANLTWGTKYPQVQEMGLKVGDYVEVGYQAVRGSVNLDGAGVNVVGKTFVVEIPGDATITVTFTGVNPLVGSSATAPGGIVEQVRAALPSDFTVELLDIVGGKGLSISSPRRFKLTTAGTSHTDVMGFASSSNWIADTGTYEITALEPSGVRSVAVKNLDGTAFLGASTQNLMQFRFIRPSSQRISSTDMTKNVEDGLYFFDVQLISAEADDKFNISDDTEMTLTGHESEGYRLKPSDDVRTFSTAEKVKLEVHPIALRPGTKDLLSNADLLPGSKVQISYERAPTVSKAQDILLLDSERVINDNPLARHFFPAYARFTFEYAGGSEADIVKADLVAHIDGLQPGDPLEAFDLQAVARDRNANYVKEPLTMIVVAHQKGRTIKVYRSKDRITLSRNEYFVADEDVIAVTRT